jgi:hypothetical protein
MELPDFQAENAILKGDYMQQVVDIVIGGIPTVSEICIMCLFISLSRICCKAPYRQICLTQ